MRPPSAAQAAKWLKALGPVIERAAGTVLDRRAVVDLAREACKATGRKDADAPDRLSAAAYTLSGMEGQSYDVKMLSRNLLRLLANWHFVDEGMAVPEWDGSAATADAAILGVIRLNEASGGRPRHLLTLKLKTGLCAGIIQCASLTDEAIAAFLRSGSGAGSLNPAVEEVSGMEARLSVSLAQNGFLRVLGWSTTDTQKRHNRDLTERRSDPRKCRYAPRPCNVCSMTADKCPLAVWLPQKEKKA